MQRLFTLYKEKAKTGQVWYARFWDQATQKYKYCRSTGIPVEGKKERRYEAEEVAKRLLEQLTATETATPHNVPTLTSQDVSNATPQTSQVLPKPLTKTSTTANIPLIQYLNEFWTETSDYADYKRDVKKKPLTTAYVEMNHEDIRRHVEPFPLFNGVSVGSLNKSMLKKWLTWLAGRKTIRRKKDGTIIEGDTMSPRRANSILQAVRVAVRWAVDNDDIPTDPFHRLGEVVEDEDAANEKGVLTLEEKWKLANAPVTNYHTRLAVLLGSYCGLRRGEKRGLQWEDISDGIINVVHNYQDKEGLKKPKYNSKRKVPIPEPVQKLLDIARKYEGEDITPVGYIFKSPVKQGKPVSNNFFRDGVEKELLDIGISKDQQKERNLTCHSLRHTFVTHAELAGIPDVVIRALTGHKSEKVKRKYSHVPQVIDFETTRKKLEVNPMNEAEVVHEPKLVLVKKEVDEMKAVIEPQPASLPKAANQ